MNAKINIAELLKDCPKGMKLYSPLCGECYFDRLNFGTIICKKQNTQEITFTSNGYYMLPVFENCECMIFPSKDQRDWGKFQRPFKDGDIISNGRYVAIFHKTDKPENCVNSNVVYYHCWYNNKYTYNKFKAKIDFGIGCIEEYKYATEKEKEKLFDAIKDNGYKWNAETKTLEKLPKFKVGDTITNGKTSITIGYIDNEYYYEISRNIANRLFIKNQDEWNLVLNKFDITTFVPFESRVLVRDNNLQKWSPAIWGYYDFDSQYCPYKIIGGAARYCIPYEGNRHLLGTTNDCDEYYKTWEK